mgnify:CR=1 FL=1
MSEWESPEFPQSLSAGPLVQSQQKLWRRLCATTAGDPPKVDVGKWGGGMMTFLIQTDAKLKHLK